MQIRTLTIINNTLKIYINIICRKGYFGVKYVVFSENHGKLEIKKVINGQIFIIYAYLVKEYLILYLFIVFPLSMYQHNKKKSLK